MLNFHKGSEGYGAITGNWPAQRRAVVYKSGPEWRLSLRKHVPGKGFVEFNNTDHPTLKAAKAAAERAFGIEQ